MASEARYDVFSSHHSADKPEFEMLARRLVDEARLRPFLDKWHLTPGVPWQAEIEQALLDSATAAVFFGPHGEGPWHNEEMRVALDRAARTRDDFRVFPVLLPGADQQRVGGFLRQRTWVDFRAGLDDEDAFRRLVAAVKGEAFAAGPYELPDEPVPYRGLRRFEAEQREFFFGRDDDIRRLATERKRSAERSVDDGSVHKAAGHPSELEHEKRSTQSVFHHLHFPVKSF